MIQKSNPTFMLRDFKAETQTSAEVLKEGSDIAIDAANKIASRHQIREITKGNLSDDIVIKEMIANPCFQNIWIMNDGIAVEHINSKNEALAHTYLSAEQLARQRGHDQGVQVKGVDY